MNTAPESFPAWVNGRIVAPGEPAVPAEDEGLLLGLSVYDTLLHEDGCCLFREQHLERFASGLSELSIVLAHDPSAALDELVAHIGAARPRSILLRLTATRGRRGDGATLMVTVRPAESLPERGVRVALAEAPKAAADHTEGIKSTNRLRNVLAREAAHALGAWEVLFATTEGHLSEGAISNVFVVLEDQGGPLLATPSLEQACLAGITRQLILADLEREPLVVDGRALPLVVGPVAVGDLARAREVLLTNTSERVIPIYEVLGRDGLPIEARLTSPGPIARALRSRFAQVEARYRAGLGLAPA